MALSYEELKKAQEALSKQGGQQQVAPKPEPYSDVEAFINNERQEEEKRARFRELLAGLNKSQLPPDVAEYQRNLPNTLRVENPDQTPQEEVKPNIYEQRRDPFQPPQSFIDAQTQEQDILEDTPRPEELPIPHVPVEDEPVVEQSPVKTDKPEVEPEDEEAGILTDEPETEEEETSIRLPHEGEVEPTDNKLQALYSNYQRAQSMRGLLEGAATLATGLAGRGAQVPPEAFKTITDVAKTELESYAAQKAEEKANEEASRRRFKDEIQLETFKTQQKQAAFQETVNDLNFRQMVNQVETLERETDPTSEDSQIAQRLASQMFGQDYSGMSAQQIYRAMPHLTTQLKLEMQKERSKGEGGLTPWQMWQMDMAERREERYWASLEHRKGGREFQQVKRVDDNVSRLSDRYQKSGLAELAETIEALDRILRRHGGSLNMPPEELANYKTPGAGLLQSLIPRRLMPEQDAREFRMLFTRLSQLELRQQFGMRVSAQAMKRFREAFAEGSMNTVGDVLTSLNFVREKAISEARNLEAMDEVVLATYEMRAGPRMTHRLANLNEISFDDARRNAARKLGYNEDPTPERAIQVENQANQDMYNITRIEMWMHDNNITDRAEAVQILDQLGVLDKQQVPSYFYQAGE